MTEEEPSSYHSGRVRIIGAEPAGDSMRDATGPVVEEQPDLPHWNDAPTGQVPAVLDRSSGEDPAVAPPTWREEENDWEAQEEIFEPAMLSDDLPAVGALLGEKEEGDVERAPWHFESDDTLVIPPEPGSEAEPVVEIEEVVVVAEEFDFERELEPAEVARVAASDAPASASAAAASRLTPPSPPEPKARAPRTTRVAATSRTGNVNTAGTGGRDMRVAVGSGLVLGVAALICFSLGTVAAMVIVTIVLLLAAAEAYAAFRRAQYHPATLLGLVACLSLAVETYNKGVAALPLVLVLVVAGSFVWYLAKVEPAADPVSGMTSTVFVFVWVGAFGSFAALLLDPTLVPGSSRHRVPARRHHRDRGGRRGLALGRLGHGPPPVGPLHQPEQELGGPHRRRRGRHLGVGDRGPLHPSRGRSARHSSSASSWPSSPHSAT